MPEAAKIQFKRGLLQNLPQQIQDGAIYITTDEHSMYMDYGQQRIRIGDFVPVNTLAELQAISPIYETALYYVKQNNILARWKSADVENNIPGHWVQINKAGIVGITNNGTGNVISNISTVVDPNTGEMSLVITKTSVATVETLDDLQARVTALETASSTLQTNVGTLMGAANVQGSVLNSIAAATDALLNGETTYTTFKTIGDRLRALESLSDTVADLGVDLTALETTVGGHTTTLNTLTAGDTTSGSIDYKIKQERLAREAADTTLTNNVSDLRDDVDDLIPTVNSLDAAVTTLTGDASTSGSVLNTVNAQIAAVVANAPQDFDTLKEISDWISSHADSASAMNTAITNLGDAVDDLTTTVTSHTTDLSALEARMDAAEDDIDDLENNVDIIMGDVNTSGSILYHINNATQILQDLIDDLNDAVTILNGNSSVVGSVQNTVDTAVAAEAALRAALETRFETLLGVVNGHTTTLSSHTTAISNLEDNVDDLGDRVTLIETTLNWQEY